MERDEITSNVTTFETLYNLLNRESLFDNYYRLFRIHEVTIISNAMQSVIWVVHCHRDSKFSKNSRRS